MNSDFLNDLPDDISLCHELIKKLFADNQRLALRLQEMVRKKYGKSSEKLTDGQLRIVFAELQNELSDLEESKPLEKEPEKNKKHGGGGRKITQANENVEEEVKTYTLPEDEIQCPHCCQQRVEFGKEITKELEYNPPTFKIIKHVQVKYTCSNCQGQVAMAPKPETLAIEKGAPSFNLLSQIITSKYLDHLPLYRQEQIYSRLGVEISRSSMCRWLYLCADKLKIIYELIVEDILKSKVVQADETPLKYLKPKSGKAQSGYLWTYLGDYNHSYVAFSFHTNRRGINPTVFLKSYSGYLQSDAYAGYNKIQRRDDIIPLGCMAHVRRKFDAALKSDNKRANYVLLEIAKLYKLEKEIYDLPDEEKSKLRKKDALPILDKLKNWLIEIRPGLLNRMPFTVACEYMLNNYEKLIVYAEKGYLSIDNNAAERALRPIAIGRKNWLFLGNDGAGETFSILATIVNSCKINGINAFEYLKDVLKKLTIGDYNDAVDLLPLNWIKNQNQNLEIENAG